jgi:glycosyltransferase involved in cell wall biosynthesis
MPEMSANPPGEETLSGLSIVLPAFNEEDNIETAVQAALEVASKIAREFEVIVVDDGSRDGTAEIVQSLVTDRHPAVRMLRHLDNKGFGAALRTGFSRARYEHVFYTDADRQFDIGELVYFVPLMRRFDVITGFRVYRYDTAFRIVASWGYNLLVRLLFRVKIRDVDCSFKVFRREVLDKITIESDDFFVDTELIAKARKWNFRIAEKGVRHYPRVAGETSVNAGDIPRTLRTVTRMWQRIHYPTKRQIEATAEIERGLAESAVEAVPTPR